jgi:PAS domain S-box-containing protein
VALVTILDGERERVAASVGIDVFAVNELDLPCDFVIDEAGIERVDCIVFGDPLSPSTGRGSWRTHAQRARAYVRVPLIGNQEEVVGSVCVVDYQARRWEDEDVSCLLDLSDAAMTDAACRLRESEERYQRLIGVSHDAILVHAKGTILYANAAAAQMIGVETASALEQRSILDLIHPDDREEVRKRIRYVLANHTSSDRAEFRFLREDGSVLPVELSGTCVPYRGSDAVLVVCRDASSKHAFDELFLASEEQLEAITRAMDTGAPQPDLLGEIIGESPDLVALANPDGSIRYLNAAARRFIGLGVNAPLDRMSTDAFHPAPMLDQLDKIAVPTALISGSWSGDSQIIAADGAVVPVWQTLIAHRDTAGDLKMMSTVMRVA